MSMIPRVQTTEFGQYLVDERGARLHLADGDDVTDCQNYTNFLRTGTPAKMSEKTSTNAQGNLAALNALKIP